MIGGLSDTLPLALLPLALARPRSAHEPPRSPQISRCRSPANPLGKETNMAVINAKVQ
jgi:hypothetical protein